MDARDELRAALQGQQANEDGAANWQRTLNDERAEYEEKEAEAIDRLVRMAETTVEALNEHAPAQRVPLDPKASRWLRKETIGWEVALPTYGSWERRHLLCPDGRLLIEPGYKRSGKAPPPEYASLAGWVEWQIEEPRRPGKSGSVSPFERAFDGMFRPAPGPISFHISPGTGIMAALQRQEGCVVKELAKILRTQGVRDLA